MANHGETYSPDIHSVFVETNLDTCLGLTVHKDEIISNFKDKLLKQHKQVFPQIGEIIISALKVKLQGKFYHLSDSMNVYKAFDGFEFRKNWFMYVDAVKVEEGGVLTIMTADDKRSNLDLVKEFTIGSELEDVHTKDLILEESLETEVVEKKTKKRKIKSSDRKTSRKKSKVDLNVDTTKLCEALQGEFAPQSSVVSSGVKLDDVLTGADIENGEKKGVGTGDNHQTCDADKLLDENIVTVNADLVDGHNMDVVLVKDGPDNDTVKEALEKLDDLTKAKELELDQGKDLPALGLADGQISHDEGRDEGSTLTPSAVYNLQTAELVTYVENPLEASSGLTSGPAREKRRKRTKSSKEQINQSPAPLTTTSRKIVKEINDVPGNVDCVDTTSKSCPISERVTLRDPFVEAIQKETEMGVNSVGDVGRADIETDNLVSRLENHVEANSVLITSPVTEKKKKRKRHSKDHNNQSATAVAATVTAATASTEIVHKISGVSENVDADTTSELCPISKRGNLGIENEMGEKITEDVESRKAIPSSVDNTDTDNLVSYPQNQLVVSSGLTTGPTTEKKKKRKKSSKDQLTTATNTSKKIVNERENISESIDANSDTPVNAIQNENAMGEGVCKVGSREDTIIDENNLQVAGLASTPAALIHESKMLDQTEKSMGENPCFEHDVSKENVERDADEANSFKSTNKKSSKKSKTRAKENILVDSGSQNVEPIKVVDREGPENIIRDVVDSLQQRKEAEENLDKRSKKSSKRSKKKNSFNIVDEAQVVNTLQKKNTAEENLEKNVKTSEKKDSEILVDSGSQNVEPIKVVDREGPENIIRDVVDSLQQRKEAEEKLDKRSKKSSKRSKKKNSLNIVDEAQVVNTLQKKNTAEENLEKYVKTSSKRSEKKDSLDIVEEAQILSVEVNTAAQKEASPINNSKDTDTPFTPSKKNTDDITRSMQILRENADMGDNFGSVQKDSIVGGEKEDQITKKEKKSLDLHPGGSIDGSIKLKDRKGRVQPSSSGTSQLQSKPMDDYSGSKVDLSDASVKSAVNDKKEAVKKSSKSATLKKSEMNDKKKKETVKKISNSVTSNKRKTNFFKDVEDESKTTSHVSTKTPSDSSSEDDSDVTSMSRKQENNLVGGTNRLSGSLQDILRSSKSYKAAKLTATKSQPDEFDDENPGLDVVPVSQAI